MIGNLLSNQAPEEKRTKSMVPPGMGELNYLQSLIAAITNQELNTTASPTFVGATFTGLTASLPIVTNASKALASVSYTTFKASLAIAQADVAGLTTASSPTFVGLTLSGLTASVPVVTDANKALASVTYAAFKASLAIDHGADLAGLADDDHPQYIRHALGTAIGDLLTASGVGAFTRLADVAAGQPLLSGGVSTAPAYAGYTFSGTAAQTYTFPSTTSTLLATTGSPAALVIASQAAGDLLYASSASAWVRLPIGDAGKALVVGVLGTPQWQAIFTNPMDDAGQLIYGGASGVPTKLAAGATTTILVGGGAAAPVWTTATGTGAPARAGSPTFTTQITAPLIIGGTGTTDDLILRTTSGAGASGADMIFQTGNNGATEAMRILYDGKVGIGTTAPVSIFQVKAATNENFAVGAHQTIATGIIVQAYNDAANANVPIEFRATQFYFDTGYVGFRIAPVSTVNLYVKGFGATNATYPIYCLDSNSADIFYVNNAGTLWIKGNCDADSYTGHCKYPDNLNQAYDVINSFKGIKGEVDHTKIHPFIRGDEILSGREDEGIEIMATLTCMAEVVNDLVIRLSSLDKKSFADPNAWK